MYDEQYEAWAEAVFKSTRAYYLYHFHWMCRRSDAADMQGVEHSHNNIPELSELGTSEVLSPNDFWYRWTCH
jgi:hypothetical protein